LVAAVLAFEALSELSDLAAGAVDSLLELEEESDDELLECDAEPLRLSVLYQPDPLKITPAG
jgi:hypothetical protein